MGLVSSCAIPWIRSEAGQTTRGSVHTSTRVHAHGYAACVCGRWMRLWVAEGACECLAVCGFVDVGAFECLQALLGCLHAYSLMCMCV